MLGLAAFTKESQIAETATLDEFGQRNFAVPIVLGAGKRIYSFCRTLHAYISSSRKLGGQPYNTDLEVDPNSKNYLRETPHRTNDGPWSEIPRLVLGHRKLS